MCHFLPTHDSPLFDNVLANDYDYDGDPLAAALVSAPIQASVFMLQPNGSFYYGPLPGWTGMDSFVYKASDSIRGDDGMVEIYVGNSGPYAVGLPDVYRGVPFLDDAVIDLNAYFDDPDDTDAELTFTVTNSNASLVNDSLNASTGELTLTFPTDDGSSASITVRATDPCGSYVEDTFEVYVVTVDDFQVEWHKPDGTWQASASDELLWDDDELSWTAEFGPKFPPYIEGVDWVADGLDAFSDNPDGATVYPERLEAFPTALVHDIVDVDVTILPIIPDRNAVVHLRVFDPDHAAGDPDPNFDTNGVLPNDNVEAGGGRAEPGGSLTAVTLTLAAGVTQGGTFFVVDAKQPGNNFIVGAA